MAVETIIIIVDDLMFLPKLETTLLHLGYQPLVATDELTLNRAIGTAPVLAIIDLREASRTFAWERLVGFIKGKGKKGNHVPILGFGPHVDLELRERALAAGCEAVVGRGAIVSQLPHLIEKHKWVVDPNRCQDTPPPLVRAGIKLLNEGAYFECHEVLEEAWNEEQGPLRLMYQGILQIGVACYHIQNKNWRGAMKLLERGLPKVERFAPTCLGLDLAKLIADTGAIHNELIRLGPAWQGEFNPNLFPILAIPAEE